MYPGLLDASLYNLLECRKAITPYSLDAFRVECGNSFVGIFELESDVALLARKHTWQVNLFRFLVRIENSIAS